MLMLTLQYYLLSNYCNDTKSHFLYLCDGMSTETIFVGKCSDDNDDDDDDGIQMLIFRL